MGAKVTPSRQSCLHHPGGYAAVVPKTAAQPPLAGAVARFFKLAPAKTPTAPMTGINNIIQVGVLALFMALMLPASAVLTAGTVLFAPAAANETGKAIASQNHTAAQPQN
jgi:hypothetical protein